MATKRRAEQGRAYGYARVSTTAQADESESLAVQQRKLEGWALQAGVPLTKVYVERGVSGSRSLEDRPQGHALRAVLKPGDTVVAAKLDRMFRNASDALRVLEDFKRHQIHLVLLDMGSDSCTGNGISALIFTVLAAVAAFERERIAERIAEGKQNLKRKGKFMGGTRPFGYMVRKDGELVEIPREQAALETMRRLRQQGQSLRTIAAAVQKRHQIRVSHMIVQRVLSDDAQPAGVARVRRKIAAQR